MVAFLTKNEIAYIQEEYNYKNLYGIHNAQCDKQKAQQSLLKKKIIFPIKDYFELQNEIRLLFDAWRNVRFVMIRPDLCDFDHDLYLLSDEKYIIYYMRDKDVFNIRFIEVNYENLQLFMRSCMQFKDLGHVLNSFNVKLSPEISNLLINDGSKEAIINVNKVTGLPVDWLIEYRNEILSADRSPESYCSVFTEDLKQNINCLTKIVKTDQAIFAFKRRTQDKNDSAVIIKGGTEFVINCMSNF